jgi:hypothetical protein
MLGNDRSAHGDRFEMDEWLDSVADETIVFGETDGEQTQSMAAGRGPSLCGNCEETVLKIARKGELPLDCPLCGQRLAGLESGAGTIRDRKELPDRS